MPVTQFAGSPHLEGHHQGAARLALAMTTEAEHEITSQDLRLFIQSGGAGLAMQSEDFVDVDGEHVVKSELLDDPGGLRVN
jgi:hypothetical protein